MATALQLAETQRRAQAALMAAIVRRIRLSWRQAIEPRDAADLADQWVRRMLPIVLQYRARSEALARVSYRQQRLVVVGSMTGYVDPGPDDFPPDALAISLAATGIAEYLHDVYEGGMTHDQALERSATTVSGAAAKHALDGGRSYLQRTIASDIVTVGWYRVTKDKPCAFCAVLASRGAVYREDSFEDSDPRWRGNGEEKVHDHCACTLAPLFSREQGVPDRNLEYLELWKRATRADAEDVLKGRARFEGQTFSGKDALNSFRRKYEKLYLDSTD